ncbi:MAG: hypothetical protein C4334_13220 [Pyrinomonas sp.]
MELELDAVRRCSRCLGKVFSSGYAPNGAFHVEQTVRAVSEKFSPLPRFLSPIALCLQEKLAARYEYVISC